MKFIRCKKITKRFQDESQFRRRVFSWVVLLWLVPGLPVSFFLKNSVPYLVGMSWFACFFAAVCAWAAETPVEIEEEICEIEDD